MLSQKYRLRKEREFKSVLRRGRQIETEYLRVKVLKNCLKTFRVGMVVSKKISGKATVRNLVKRRLSETMRYFLPALRRGFDIVIIAKPKIIHKKYPFIKEELAHVLEEADLLKNS